MSDPRDAYALILEAIDRGALGPGQPLAQPKPGGQPHPVPRTGPP